MQSRKAVLAAFILVVSIPVYAESPSKSRLPGKSSLERMINRALSSGESTTIPGLIATVSGFRADVGCRHFIVTESSSTDEQSHQFHLAVEASSAAPSGVVPVGVLLDAGDGNDDYFFRLSLEGRLEKALWLKGETLSEMKLDAPDTKARLQHELDFWLKNAYRKPSKPKKPAR